MPSHQERVRRNAETPHVCVFDLKDPQQGVEHCRCGKMRAIERSKRTLMPTPAWLIENTRKTVGRSLAFASDWMTKG